MGFGETLKKEIPTIAVSGIIIVMMLVVLDKLKNVSGVTAATNTTIDNFASGIGEVSTWVSIMVIAIVGAGVIGYFMSKKYVN